MMDHAPYGAGFVIIGLLWFLMFLVALVVAIIILIAIWRAMRAHESIADSLRRMADASRPPEGKPPG